MGIAAAEQIARLLAQVEPLSRDNERLAADNARLARDAAEAGRAHQGVVRDAVADRLRAQRQARQRASPCTARNATSSAWARRYRARTWPTRR